MLTRPATEEQIDARTHENFTIFVKLDFRYHK